MFDYLKQFKSLPKELREKISSPVAMKTLSDLEEKYKVNLASTVMKVMVKKININNLASHLVSEFSLNPENANKLSEELKEKLFFTVSGYLGITPSFKQEEKQAEIILKNSGISFSDKNLYNRSIKVLTTFLRGVRSRIDTRLVLEKPEKSGGLGLSQEEVDHLIKTTINYIANLETEPPKEEKFSVESTPLTQSDDLTKLITKEKTEKEAEFNLKKEIEAGRTPSIPAPEKIKKIEGRKEEIKRIEEKKEDKPKEEKEEIKDDRMSFAPPPKKGLMNQIFKTPKKEKSEEEKQKIKEAPKKEQEPKTEEKQIKTEEKKEEKIWSSKPRPVSDSGSKKKIEDIKTAPKVMGPIDELKYLSLVNFRRLSEEPQEATLKIRKKIELLEKDGFDKKIKGILAWKKSPVNRLYILLGQEAVKKGISLQKLTEERLEKNKESLSWEEVRAVMDLNAKLSYY